MFEKKQIFSSLLSGIFVFFLILPLCLFLISSNGEISKSEKRKFATLPKVPVTLADWKAFPEKMDAYYRDHFGLRDALIKLHNFTLINVFGIVPSDLVVKGKDGWYFYKAGGVLEDYWGQAQGGQVAEGATFEVYSSIISERQEWLAKQGIRYLFLPVPNKIDIYGDEYLPYRVRRNRGQSFHSKFLSYVKEEKPNLNVLDFRPSLLLNKERQQLYLKTDTHWSHDGAMLGYDLIRKRCSTWFPGRITAIDESNISRKNIPFSGDLTYLMNMRGFVEESATITNIKKTCENKIKNHPPLSLELLDQPISDTPRRYPTETGCPNQSLTAIVIHDSFGNFLKKYLTERFKKVIYSHAVDFNGLSELILKENPKLLLQVIHF